VSGLSYRERVRLARLSLAFVRWWFGLSYVLAGAGCLIAAPIMIAGSNYGGLYMLVGGPLLGALGWVVHPWGLQRKLQGA
jgi:hypothetical protein